MPGKLKRSSIVPIADEDKEHFKKAPRVLSGDWQPPNEEGKGDLQDRDCQYGKYDYPEKEEETRSFQRPASHFMNTRLQELSNEISTEIITAVVVEQNEEKYIDTTAQDNKTDIYIKTIRREIFQKLYKEAKERVAIEEMDVPTATCTEQCTDLCCQSCICNFKAIFSRRKNRVRIYTDNLMTPALRRGRTQGWGMYKQIISSSVEDSTRVTWVVAQFLTSLLILLLSIVAIGLNETQVATFATLACAILCSVLAALDTTFTLWSCQKCRNCRIACKAEGQSRDSVSSIFNESQMAEDIQGRQETEFVDHDFLVNNRNQTDTEPGCSVCQAVSDVLRNLLSEFFIYVFIICGIFEAVIGQGRTTANKVSITILIISSVCLLLFVHIPRIVIFRKMIKNVQTIRSISLEEHRSKGRYDPSISKRGLFYQIYLLTHMAMQMVVQAMILVSIGGKVIYENQQFFDMSVYNDELTISSHLWCMITIGYFLPIMGILTAFSTTFFWAQEFPVGLCLDLVSITEIIAKNSSESTDLKKTLKVIDKFLNVDHLMEDYHNLRQKGFLKKFLYPFRTPTLVTICMIYAILVTAFVVSAGVSSTEGSLQSQILNGGGWIVCYILTILLFIATNAYATLVAATWTAVISAIFLVILMFIAACICNIAACFDDRPSV